MEAILVAKLISLIIVLVISLILGSLPYFIIRRRNRAQGLGRRGDIILSVFNAFSGGVFLGACLLHLMDEGREELEEAFTLYDLEEIKYPLFEVIVAVGFFAIVLVDFVAELCLHESTSIVLEDGKPKQNSTVTAPDGEVNGAFMDPNAHPSVSTLAYGAITENQSKRPVVEQAPRSNGITLVNHTYTGDISTNNNNNNSDNHTAHPRTGEVVTPNVTNILHHAHNHEHGHDFDQLAKTSTVRAVLLLVALSFHTIFDGLAIGLQDMDTDVWQVLAAISIHKALVAFCLGLQLFQAYTRRFRTAAILVALFSIMSPIGIGLGILVTSANINEAAQTMTAAVLQGVASGTFLYVTFFEILKEAFTHGRGIWNIFIAGVGFATMAAVKLLDSD
ncbi:zinc transporter ZIP1 [Patella vulgata]|uniref:zinc transporter ZIP1 n=1 Tax=Patella vulgata TaxID=6465 RepID=UPI0024A8E04A|nr:zinc transporter ZIP1 [Patella vulgata]